MARATRAGAQCAGATASTYATFGKKKRGRSKREKEETEGERRIAERKRMREKHVVKAIEEYSEERRKKKNRHEELRIEMVFLAMK